MLRSVPEVQVNGGIRLSYARVHEYRGAPVGVPGSIVRAFRRRRREQARPFRPAAALALILTALVGASLLSTPLLASAETGTISNLEVTVLNDGVAPFDGLDADASNKRIRTNDRVTYALSATFGAAGDVTFSSTLPEGMEWDPSALSATVCNGPEASEITDDQRTWTCSRSGSGVESFNVSAWIRHLGDGASVAPVFTADARSRTAPTLTVVAEAKTELKIYTDPDTIDYGYVKDGIAGVRMRLDVVVGATVPSGGDFRGYEAPAHDFDFGIRVPDDAVVLDAVPRLTIGGGTRAVVQPGGPGSDATVSVSGAHLDYHDFAYDFGAPDYVSLSQTSVYLWMPYSTIPAGQSTVITGQVFGFDPESLSGASNFGTGAAPGQDPAYTCPSPAGDLTKLQLACFKMSLDRTADYRVVQAEPAAIRGARQILFGDGHGYVRGDEYILPGQHFEIVEQMWNEANALKAATDPEGCVVLRSPIKLDGSAEVSYRDANGISGGVYMWTGTDITDAPGVTVEYTNRAFSGEGERAGYWCWDGNDTWVDDPADLSGGSASVTAVRYRVDSSDSGIRLEPRRYLGVKVPVQRTAASLSATEMNWWGSHETAETGESMKVRTAVKASNAMVRNAVEWSDTESTAGLLSDLTLRPFVYGPVGGSADTVANNTRITLNLGTSCLAPDVSSLDGLGVSYTYTPADAGADGIVCTDDDGAAGTIVFNLGNVNAPRGPAGGAFHQFVGGHETSLAPLTFQLRYDPRAAVGTTQTVSSVISSSADGTRADLSASSVDSLVDGPSNLPSLMDRTATAATKLTGMSVFTVTKEAITATPGHVDTGEEFAYKIAWGNPTSDSNGLGYFVDVLPFDGDGRGTVGVGSQHLEVLGVSAETGSTASGEVYVEYTQDDPADVMAAIRQSGNEGGQSGVTWHSGTVPGNATALRFRTEKPISSGYSGEATIEVKAPALSIGGTLVNDVYGRAEANGGVPAKVLIAQASVPLSSSLGAITGSVYRDLDFDGAVSAEDGVWPAATGIVELLDGTDVVATSNVNAAGKYNFSPVAAGEYALRLTAAASSGWSKVLPSGTVELEAGGASKVDLLYQEQIAAPDLENDTASASRGQQVNIDVTANDTIPLPAVGPWSGYDGLTAVSAPSHGVAAVVAGTDGEQGTVDYTASGAWPSAFDGQTSYTDTFTYTWTNPAGVSDTATVSVTVHAETELVDDAQTIPDQTRDIDVLANDGGDGLVLTSVTATAGDADVSVVAGRLRVTPTHDWGVGELSHQVTVKYAVDSAGGDADTAIAVITVRRAPVVEGGSAVIPDEATADFDANPLTAGTIEHAQVTTPPAQGSASADESGAVRYTADGTGLFTFSVTFTDDLGQTVVADYTVRVQNAPAAADASVTIPLGGSYTFDSTVTTGGQIVEAELVDPATPLTVTPAQDGSSTAVDATNAPAGSYTFQVRYTDDTGQSAVSTFVVTVQAPPSFDGAAATIPVGGSHSFDVDISTAGTIVATQSIVPNGGGSVGESGSGTSRTLKFDGAGLEPGDYSFAYEAEDDLGQTHSAEFTVRVQAPPTAVGGSVVIPMDGSHTFDARVSSRGSIEKVNVIEAPGQEFPVLEAGADGLVFLEATGLDAGTRSFEVEYIDDLEQSTSARFEVTIQAPPTGTGESVTLRDDRATAKFDVLPRVTGVGLQPLTRGAVVQPAHGKVTLNTSAHGVVYTPERGFVGTTTFTVDVFDDLGQSVVLEYTVTIPSLHTVPDPKTPPGDDDPDGDDPGTGTDDPETGTDLPGTGSLPLALPLGAGFGVLLLGGATAAFVAARRRRAVGEEAAEETAKG